jgi:hypothetical protein
MWALRIPSPSGLFSVAENLTTTLVAIHEDERPVSIEWKRVLEYLLRVDCILACGAYRSNTRITTCIAIPAAVKRILLSTVSNSTTV